MKREYKQCLEFAEKMKELGAEKFQVTMHDGQVMSFNATMYDSRKLITVQEPTELPLDKAFEYMPDDMMDKMRQKAYDEVAYLSSADM